jgi:hypothetical protein
MRTNSKFGIEVPKTIKRALELDKETGTTFWADAIDVIPYCTLLVRIFYNCELN